MLVSTSQISYMLAVNLVLKKEGREGGGGGGKLLFLPTYPRNGCTTIALGSSSPVLTNSSRSVPSKSATSIISLPVSVPIHLPIDPINSNSIWGI